MGIGHCTLEGLVTMHTLRHSAHNSFWNGKRVFLTGHTGFKGSWLTLWLQQMGAVVSGYALEPPTTPCLYDLANVGDGIHSVIADVRDGERLKQELSAARPEIVLHLAAQPLVRDSYKIPVETYAVNVMGTVNLLEAVRCCPSVRAVVNVTTDKVYENREWAWGYRENEPLGGYDPYSNSKACSEMVTSAYRSSYFNPSTYGSHGVGIATARAGNVIGGGDWATDRLIPDILRSLMAGEPVTIRNPYAIRPWQHVLEPLYGYLLLAQRLYEAGDVYADSWNFGPCEEDAKPVEWIVKRLCQQWHGDATYRIDEGEHPHEAHYLKLDSTRARGELKWHPRWNLDTALQKIMDWTGVYTENGNLQDCCLRQIEEYGESV